MELKKVGNEKTFISYYPVMKFGTKLDIENDHANRHEYKIDTETMKGFLTIKPKTRETSDEFIILKNQVKEAVIDGKTYYSEGNIDIGILDLIDLAELLPKVIDDVKEKNGLNETKEQKAEKNE